MDRTKRTEERERETERERERKEEGEDFTAIEWRNGRPVPIRLAPIKWTRGLYY